jgi:uncharacterized protein
VPVAKAGDREFFDAFNRHAAVCVNAGEELVKLFDDLSTAKASADKIKELEGDGDTITHETIKRLHEMWITPLDRADIHELITGLDDVLDLTEAVSERVLLFGLRKQRATASGLASKLLEATQAVAKAVAMLPDVSRRSKELLALCVELNRLENEADALYRQGLSELFNRRPDGTSEPPREPATPDDVLEVMKWREIYDYLENATDACEDLANVLEGIVLEYA